jgi:hypothetical protein
MPADWLLDSLKYTSAAFSNGLVQHQPAFLIRDLAAPLHQLYYLIGRFEVPLAGKRSLQILFKEFHNPYRGQEPIDAL